MRLEPVYVVAPAASVPTRRAFLLAGGTFAAGMSLGGACGYALGARRAAVAPGPADAAADAAAIDEMLKPSGDVELDELRRLAVKAPIEELVEARPVFLTHFSRKYRSDRILWIGIERLCEAVIARTEITNRRIAAQSIIQVVENCEAQLQAKLSSHLMVLRSIR